MTMLQALTLETAQQLPHRLPIPRRLRACRHSSRAALSLEANGDLGTGVVADALDVSDVKHASGLPALCRPISKLVNEER